MKTIDFYKRIGNKRYCVCLYGCVCMYVCLRRIKCRLFQQVMLGIGHLFQIYWLLIFLCKNLIFNSNETCYMFKNANLSQNLQLIFQ